MGTHSIIHSSTGPNLITLAKQEILANVYMLSKIIAGNLPEAICIKDHTKCLIFSLKIFQYMYLIIYNYAIPQNI